MADTVVTFNCATGELVTREMTPDEQAAYDAAQAEFAIVNDDL